MKNLITALAAITLFLYGGYTEAIEVQLQSKPVDTTDDIVKKIDELFKSHPFPDAAYTVELDKDVAIEACKNVGYMSIKLTQRELIKNTYYTGTGDIIHDNHKEGDVCLRVLPKLIPNIQFISEWENIFSQISSVNDYERMFKKIEERIYKKIEERITTGKARQDNIYYNIYFPFLIRYELKDDTGKTIQIYDTYIDEVFINRIDSARYPDIFYKFGYEKSINLSNSTIYDHLGLKVAPDKIKEIVAYVATVKGIEEAKKQEESPSRRQGTRQKYKQN